MTLPASALQVPVLKPMDLMVEVSPRRIFANGHTYHINSISVNSDCETYMSADDLRINLWHLAITDRSFSILGLTCREVALGWYISILTSGASGDFLTEELSPLECKGGKVWDHKVSVYEHLKDTAAVKAPLHPVPP